ncbi:MAG: Dyp-type peroxidase [Candidatus Nanopelagicales bacterium]
MTVSRRAVLAGGALAGTAAAVGGGVVWSQRSDAPTAEQPSFHGEHQAGIATPAQARAEVVALDLTTADPVKVRDLFQTWTDLMSTGLSQTADADLFAVPARLTATWGIGPGFLPTVGLSRLQPDGLAPLPEFSKDQLQKQWTGGDVLLQVGADDAVVAATAARHLVAAASGVTAVRWWQRGFTSATRRNLMGQIDGTANLSESDPQYAQTLWSADTQPEWMRGGSYVAIRRIRMALEAWNAQPVEVQEAVIGRFKDTGAPLNGTDETDAVDLSAQTSQRELVIPADAHVRLSNPENTRGARIHRRSFSYDDGEDGAGLIFMAWQADPRTGFIPIQARLDVGDALNKFTVAEGSALFACFPGCEPGGYVGQTLFEA